MACYGGYAVGGSELLAEALPLTVQFAGLSSPVVQCMYHSEP